MPYANVAVSRKATRKQVASSLASLPNVAHVYDCRPKSFEGMSPVITVEGDSFHPKQQEVQPINLIIGVWIRMDEDAAVGEDQLDDVGALMIDYVWGTFSGQFSQETLLVDDVIDGVDYRVEYYFAAFPRKPQ